MSPSQYKRTPPQLRDLLADGFILATEASKEFGLTNDHITSLCRSEKVQGFFVGRTWFVERESLKTHLAQVDAKREERRAALSEQLRHEYHTYTGLTPLPMQTNSQPMRVANAHATSNQSMTARQLPSS